MLKQVNEGGVVKAAEVFKFVLVATNCEVGSILPKHLDLVGFHLIWVSFVVTSVGLITADRLILDMLA